MLKGADRRVLAPNTIVLEQRPELRLDELGGAGGAKALHVGRATLHVGVGKETSVDLLDIVLPAQNLRTSQPRVVV